MGVIRHRLTWEAYQIRIDLVYEGAKGLTGLIGGASLGQKLQKGV